MILLNILLEDKHIHLNRLVDIIFNLRKMAQVHITNVIVHNNPCQAVCPFQFEITFECFKDLPGTFDWRIIYLGSPTDSQYDQIIDEFEMTDLKAGVLSFMTDSNCPNFEKIPPNEILGTTAILISA